MKRFVYNVLMFFTFLLGIIGIVNFVVDPANLFHLNIISEMVQELSLGHIIKSPGNMDEGLFQKERISSFERAPQTVIIGSSHVMYADWGFPDFYVAGVSGAYLGDYYAIVGILESNKLLPEKIVFGVDPWTFTSDAVSGRHTSIQGYAIYEKGLIDGKDIPEIVIQKSSWEKVKELFSPAYFQASVSKIKENGLWASIKQKNSAITILSDDTDTDIVKMLPNGRWTMPKSEYDSVEEMDRLVEDSIAKESMYQLGTSYTEVDLENLSEFRRLLQRMQDKGIKIEFFLHPAYPLQYNYFFENENFKGVLELEYYLLNMADEMDITLHGSFSPYKVDVDKKDFADWLHLKAEPAWNVYFEY